MPEEIVCNKCGIVLDRWDVENDFTIHKKIGYGSIHDGDTVELHLCSWCMDNLINDCLRDPITEHKTEEDTDD